MDTEKKIIKETFRQLSPADRSGFESKIVCRPDFSLLVIRVPANQTIKVESSAMASMDSHLKMTTKLKGGFSRLLSGENLFINEFTAEGSAGELCIAPGPMGDLQHIRLKGETIFLQSSGFLASTLDVLVETKWQGLVKGFFSREGLFLIKCSGHGDLWFNTFGAIIEVDVRDDFIVDNGYVVAFTEGLSYTIKPIAGMKSLFLSGEGLVSHFTGQGKIWVQTRQVPAFASWINPFRRIERRNNN